MAHGEKNISPIRLIFFQGTLAAFLYLMSFIIVFPYITCQSNWNFCEYNQPYVNLTLTMNRFFNLIKDKVLIFIFYYLISTGSIISLFETNKRYSPTHRCFSETFGAFIYWISKISRLNPIHQEEFDSLSLVWYILIFFSTLVYNEILILNCFGFEVNTRLNIIRGNTEREIILQEKELLIE